jgi:ADP-ribose pyrophosphatase YjhB (NUDIX family)
MDSFEIVRRWFVALNCQDIDALVAFYHDDCFNDQGHETWHGRVEQRLGYERLMATLGGAFEGDIRRKVRSIGRIETGAIHAEWTSRERRYDTGELLEGAGYDEFLIEHGQIRRQRSVPGRVSSALEDIAPPAERKRASRHYPTSPIVGVGAVIIADAKVVLIKRKYEPLAGQWSLPGGRLELGESLEAGLAREMLEETGLEIDVGPVIEVFDRILLDEERRVRFHYVLIDYLCRPLGGTLKGGSDVDLAIWVDPADLKTYRLTEKALAVIERALSLAGQHPWPVVKSLR